MRWVAVGTPNLLWAGHHVEVVEGFWFTATSISRDVAAISKVLGCPELDRYAGLLAGRRHHDARDGERFRCKETFHPSSHDVRAEFSQMSGTKRRASGQETRS